MLRRIPRMGADVLKAGGGVIPMGRGTAVEEYGGDS
jgi:hypothetical protein